MPWTLVNNMNKMDHSLKEMNKMDHSLKKIRMKCDQ